MTQLQKITPEIIFEARIELARRFFWDFEKLLYPDLFTDDRPLLKDMAETLQWFIEDSDKHYLVLSVPPGHFKSFTGKNLALWLMGRDPMTRIIGVANSGDLASMFSTQVRDTILGLNVGRGGIPYPLIFPSTKVKYGLATKSKWELQGSSEPSYRAVSPGSAVTGSRSDVFLIDDIIKSYLQSLNADELKKHFEFYKNTLFSRTDGDNYKFVFIMQRWATNDLAGEIINLYGDDVVKINYEIEKDGKMLEPSIMSRKKFEQAKKTLDPNVLKANYYQQPVDIEGRLYDGFDEWKDLPKTLIKKNNTDIADEGSDNVCSIDWFSVKTEEDIKVYITDIYYSSEKAEITEPRVAQMINNDDVTDAEFESNNGGKGYARNIERELHKIGNYKTNVIWTHQSSNKEARILASAAWNSRNILMPPGWKNKHPEFAAEILTYIKGGKNAHDDACFPAGTMIATLKGDVPIEKIKIGDKVITPVGLREVADSRLTGVSPVITKNGLTATPDHKVWDGNMFTRLDTLAGKYDTIDIQGSIKWKYKKLLYSMERPIDLWDREAIILANRILIKDERVHKDFTDRFGSIIQAKQYLKAMKFITKMATLITTTTATYSVYHGANTLKYIRTKATGALTPLLNMLGKKQSSGTRASKAERGIEKAQRGAGRLGSLLQRIACFVRTNIKPHSLTLYFATTTAAGTIEPELVKNSSVQSAIKTSLSSIHVQSIAQKNVKQNQDEGVNVYNITVKEAGCYYANGVLVSNCDVLATIYERAANTQDVDYSWKVS